MVWSAMSRQWLNVIMDNIFPSLIVGALVLCLIAAIVGWILSRVNGNASVNWPCVMGRIVKSDIREEFDSEGANSFYADVEYTFSVEGVPYTENVYSTSA